MVGLKPEGPPNAETDVMAAQFSGNLKLYALCGVIAPIFFTLMVIVEGFVVTGYSQVSQHISDLGAYSLYGS